MAANKGSTPDKKMAERWEVDRETRERGREEEKKGREERRRGREDKEQREKLERDMEDRH